MSSIPLRSTGRGRGQLQGAAPSARQVRSVVLRVEDIGGGMLRLSSPRIPGWVSVVRTPQELARAAQQSLTETQIAAYSAFRGTTYDSPLRHRRARPKARSARRCDVYDVTEWRVCPDTGKWVSPKGLKYPETREVVRRVIRQRIAAGLPPSPDPKRPPAPETMALVIGSAAVPERKPKARRALNRTSSVPAERARTATSGKFQLARRADPKWEQQSLEVE